MRLPREEATNLAEPISDALRGPRVKVVAGLLSEPDADELSLRQLARVERAVSSWRRKQEGLPPERRRKGG